MAYTTVFPQKTSGETPQNARFHVNMITQQSTTLTMDFLAENVSKLLEQHKKDVIFACQEVCSEINNKLVSAMHDCFECYNKHLVEELKTSFYYCCQVANERLPSYWYRLQMGENDDATNNANSLWHLLDMERIKLDEMLRIIGAYKCSKKHKTNCLSKSTMENHIFPSECDLETRGKHRHMFIRLGIIPDAATKGSALSQNSQPPIVIDNIFWIL